MGAGVVRVARRRILVRTAPAGGGAVTVRMELGLGEMRLLSENRTKKVVVEEEAAACLTPMESRQIRV